MAALSRAEALRILGLGPNASDGEIDARIASEYRTWSARTNAPDFEARTEAQRRLNSLAQAEVALLGQRQSRDAAPPPPINSNNRPPLAPNPPIYGSTPSRPLPPPSPQQWSPIPPPTSGGTRQRPTPSGANWALTLGILSLTCCGPIAGIIAVILGVMAKKQIEDSRGALGGLGSAKAGIVLGCISVGLTVIWILIVAATSGS